MNDPAALMAAEIALQRMRTAVSLKLGAEPCDLLDSIGRVLAQPVRSTISVPPLDNSAVDGYALGTGDLSTGRVWPVVARICAGDPPLQISPGEAARIFTGAAVPTGTQAVVMQEHCLLVPRPASNTGPDQAGFTISCSTKIESGQNIRPRGQDIRAGDELLRAGHRLGAAEIGLLASIGLTSISVRTRPRVVVLSTGSELVPAGRALAPGQIHDSNGPLLETLLRQAGCEVVQRLHLQDDFESTCDAMRSLPAADLVVASGGVSVGEEDHVRRALERIGTLQLWKLRIKPGKPLAFGNIGAATFIGLPGNPVAVYVCFHLFVLPLLRQMEAAIVPCWTTMAARLPAGFAITRPDSRRNFLRVRRRSERPNTRDGRGGMLPAAANCPAAMGRAEVAVVPASPSYSSRAAAAQGVSSGPGQYDWLEAFANQSSGVLNSVVWADGLAVIPEGATVAEGDLVDYLSFESLRR